MATAPWCWARPRCWRWPGKSSLRWSNRSDASSEQHKYEKHESKSRTLECVRLICGHSETLNEERRSLAYRT